MIKIKLNYLLLFAFVFLSSCIKSILKNRGVLDNKCTSVKMVYRDKQLEFIEMKHLAQNEFYDNVKERIKQLKEQGFIFICEGSGISRNNLMKIDTIAFLKFRKLNGIDLTVKYSEMKTGGFQKITDKYNLIDQPDFKTLGVDSIYWGSLSTTQLIMIYESKFGKIQLDSCDKIQQLGYKEYNCSRIDKEKSELFRKTLILDEQNKNIVAKIKTMSHKKIAIVYGKGHTSGIINLLNEETK